LNRSLVLALFAASCAAALAACSWSVPADPGLVAQCRPCKPGRGRLGSVPATSAAPAGAPASPRPAASPPSPRADDGARAIYVQHCSRCHAPFSPTHATAAEWPVFVRKYGPRAGLFGADRERVLAWLQANAR